MLRKLCGEKMNNRGSALLTTILVVGFLTILATTLLYITGMNFQIKQADYQNKKNFYTGETGLEEIKAKLMQDASEATVEAYNNVSMRYVTLSTANLRQLEYNKAFVESLQKVWDDKLALEGNNWDNLLHTYYTGGAAYNLELNPAFDSNGDGVYSSSELLEPHPVEGYIRIRGLKMTYTNPDNKLTTIISTDMDVYAPEVDWSAEGTLQTLSGITPEAAALKNDELEISGCVRYANWKKE